MAESNDRQVLIEKLQQQNIALDKTQTNDVLSKASVDLLTAILQQLKKNNRSATQNAKSMIKQQAFNQKGSQAQVAVGIQLDDKQLAKKISELRQITSQISLSVDTENSEDSVNKVKQTIQSLIVAVQRGDKQAIDFVKSLDVKNIKGLKNASSVMQKLNDHVKETNTSLNKFGKTTKNIFSKGLSSGAIKKQFTDIKKQIESTAQSVRKIDIKSLMDKIKGISLSDLKKNLTFQNVAASALTAAKVVDHLHGKVKDINKSIMNYHRQTQVLGAVGSDVMPGGAKQLDSIRRNMNLTREQAVKVAQSLTAIRGTTYGFQDINKAMIGMKNTLGQVDVDKLRQLSQIMQSIPKVQLDAFTSGSGSQGDVMNAVMNMQQSGQTDKVLQLGASGAFGEDFAKASGVEINQNEKRYINNQRAIATTKETLQNKTQQFIMGNNVTGTIASSMPFASQISNMSGGITSLLGVFSGLKGGKQQKDEEGQNGDDSNDKVEQKKNKQQNKILGKIQDNTKKTLSKKFQIKSVQNVKSVGKIKFLDTVKTVVVVNRVNSVPSTSGGNAGNVSNKMDKWKAKAQKAKNKVSGKIQQRTTSAIKKTTSKISEKTSGGMGKLLGNGSSTPSGFEITDLFQGVNIEDVFKGKFDFGSLKNFDVKNFKTWFQPLKHLKDLKQLKNLSNLQKLLKLRNTDAGRKAIKAAGAMRRGYKAYKAAKAASKVAKGAKAAKTGLTTAKAVMTGVKAGMASVPVAGWIALAAQTAAEAAIGGGINVFQDKSQATSIKQQMGISSGDHSTFSNVMDGLNGISMVLNPVGGMISSFAKNLYTTGGDLSKSFTMAGLQFQSAWKGAAQTLTFGLYKENVADKKDRQIQMAANSQNTYSVKGFKQLYKMNQRVEQLKQIQQKRNIYMAQQYAGFMKQLKLIEKSYTQRQQLQIDVSSLKMENAFEMGMSNDDYANSAKNIINQNNSAYQTKTQKIAQLRNKVMGDSQLSDTQLVTQLAHLQQQQIKARRQFLNNLKKSLDASKIPAVIQAGLNSALNKVMLDVQTAGYGGTTQGMLDAMFAQVQNAANSFAATVQFNAQAFQKVGAAEQAMQDAAFSQIEGFVEKANAARTNTMATLNQNVEEQNLLSGKDGGDFSFTDMGISILSKAQADALRSSGLLESDDIDANGRVVHGQMNDSGDQQDKQKGIKRLLQKAQQRFQSGDRAGANQILSLVEKMRDQLKDRGATTDNLDKVLNDLKNSFLTVDKIDNVWKNDNADYSGDGSDTSAIKALAGKDSAFMAMLKGRGLADSSGNITGTAEQLKKVFRQRKADVGLENSYKHLQESSEKFKNLVEQNGGDRGKAYSAFLNDLASEGDKKLGLSQGTLSSVTTAVGQAFDQMETDGGKNSIKLLKGKQKQLGQVFSNALNLEGATDVDKSNIQKGQQALQKLLTQGDKLSAQQRNKLIAQVKYASQTAAMLGGTLGQNVKAAMASISSLNNLKNSNIKTASMMKDVFQNQKNQYMKLINAIKSLQNVIAMSGDVKRAQLRQNLKKSETAMAQWRGENVGANLFDVYQAQMATIQEQVNAGKKGLDRLDQLAPKIQKMISDGGAALVDMYSNQFGSQFNGVKIKSQGGGQMSFQNAFKELGQWAKEYQNQKDPAKQQQIMKKIAQRQRELLSANDKSQGTAQEKKRRAQAIKGASMMASTVVGSGGTIDGVRLKLQTDINNATAQQIPALKNLCSNLERASQTLVSFERSTRHAMLGTKSKLTNANLGSAADAKALMQQTIDASNEMFEQQKKGAQSRINASAQALKKAQAKYSADPSKANLQELQKAKASHNSAVKGMDEIVLKQQQAAAQAFASAMENISNRASLASQKLAMLQDYAQNVAGTTAQWYKIQNEKLSVMQQQVTEMRGMVNSQKFASMSQKDQVKYKNQLMKKQLALAKERIGAQRTVFEKQLGAILGGFQSQGAFQGYNNAAVFGIGHGINQAGMAIQRKDTQALGYTDRTFSRQSRTQFSNQGTTSLSQIGDNALAMGTNKGASATVTTNKNGSTSNADNGSNPAQQGSKSTSSASASSQSSVNSVDPVQVKAQNQRQADLKKQDHQIFVDILTVIKQILEKVKGGSVATATTAVKNENLRGATTPIKKGDSSNSGKPSVPRIDVATAQIDQLKQFAKSDAFKKLPKQQQQQIIAAIARKESPSGNGVASQDKRNASASQSSGNGVASQDKRNASVTPSTGANGKADGAVAVPTKPNPQLDALRRNTKIGTVQLGQLRGQKSSAEKSLGQLDSQIASQQKRYNALDAEHKKSTTDEQKQFRIQQVINAQKALDKFYKKTDGRAFTEQERAQHTRLSLQYGQARKFAMTGGISAQQLNRDRINDSYRSYGVFGSKNMQQNNQLLQMWGELNDAWKGYMATDGNHNTQQYKRLQAAQSKLREQGYQNGELSYQRTKDKYGSLSMSQMAISQERNSLVYRKKNMIHEARYQSAQNLDELNAKRQALKKKLGGINAKISDGQQANENAKKLRILAGIQDGNVSVGDKQNAIAYWGTLNQQQRKQSGVSQQLVDDFVVQSYRKGQNIQYNKGSRQESLLAYTKTQDLKNIISQNRDKLNAAGIKTQQFTDDQIIKRLKKQGIKTDNLTSYDLDNYRAEFSVQSQNQEIKKQQQLLMQQIAADPTNIALQNKLKVLNQVSASNQQFDANSFRTTAATGSQYATTVISKANKQASAREDTRRRIQAVKDQQLIQTNDKIFGTYKTYKQQFIDNGGTAQQFQFIYGKEGQQTDKQKKAYDTLVRQQSTSNFNAFVDEGARSDYEKYLSDQREKAGGKYIRQQSWQNLSQGQRQAFRKRHKNAFNASVDQARKRQQVRQLISDNGQMIDMFEAGIRGSMSEQESRSAASDFYKARGIDFNGASQQQQQQLMDKYFRQQAEQIFVEDSGVVTKQQAQAYVPQAFSPSGKADVAVAGVTTNSTPTQPTVPGKKSAEGVAYSPAASNQGTPVASNGGGGGQQSSPVQPPPQTAQPNTPPKSSNVRVNQRATATTQATGFGFQGDGQIKIAMQGLQAFVRKVVQQTLNSASTQAQNMANV